MIFFDNFKYGRNLNDIRIYSCQHRQTTENQAFEINYFSKKNKIRVDKWIKGTISGTSALNKRKLGHLLKNM